MLHSDRMPEITYRPDIADLFMYFGINWKAISPALYVVLGCAFGYYVLRALKRMYGE